METPAWAVCVLIVGIVGLILPILATMMKDDEACEPPGWRMATCPTCGDLWRQLSVTGETSPTICKCPTCRAREN